MYSVSNAFLEEAKKPVQTHRLQGTIGSYSFDKSNIVSGTFHITNQCTDTSDVVLGSVYMGQLECTFTGLNIGYTNWIGKTITPTFGLKVGENAWEDIPLGVYRVIEAEHTAEGVYVVAYDNMRKFDRKFKKSRFQMTGGIDAFISQACADCHVNFGMTDEEVEALPNGMEVFELFGAGGKTKDFANDIETYRDLIFWIAQTLGCFATIDRLGQLVFRPFKNNVVDEISQWYRLSGAKFADYITNYTGIYVNNMIDDTESYYGYDVALLEAEIALVQSEILQTDGDIAQNQQDMIELERKHDAHEITDEEYATQKAQLEAERSSLNKTKKQLQKRLNWLLKALEKAQAGDDGTFMELGDNPFLQSDISTYRERERRRILNAVDKISYTPFSCSTVMGVHYDLGDVLYFTGGHAGEDGVFCCLMMYDWTFNGEYQMQGFGADPSIANVKSKLEKLADKANKNALDDKVFIDTETPEPRDKEGDILIKQDEVDVYSYPDCQITIGSAYTENSISGNAETGYNVEAHMDAWGIQTVTFVYSDLIVGEQYNISFKQATTGPMDRIWSNGSYGAYIVINDGTTLAPIPFGGDGAIGDAQQAYSPHDIVGKQVSFYADNEEHEYSIDFEALDTEMVFSVEATKLMGKPNNIDRYTYIKDVKMSHYDGKRIVSTYIDKVNVGGEWQDLDFVKSVVTDSVDVSDSGFSVENRVVALKPSVMRAWFKADPPQVKRTFNQYCVRFTGKPDSNIDISLQSNTGWLNKSIKKDSESVFTLKSGGTVSSSAIEYCAYKITGLTSGQRYYFNFKVNFKDGTTFGNDNSKGLGLVFNTTGVIDTDNWSGLPNTFDSENLYYSMRRSTVGNFADFSFVATASTMYMCVVVADITSGQTSSLTLSKFVISKTEREYVRDFYIFDIVSNDWLPYKPFGSGADSGGDAGASSLGNLDDVNLQSLTNGQTLYYNSETGEWVNGNAYELPIASADTLGGVKVGNRLSVDENGVLSADEQSYTLPVASADNLGGIKVGQNLSIDENGVLSAEGGGGSSDLEAIDLNQSQYNALSEAEKADLDKMYFITDGNGDGSIVGWTISALAYKQLTPAEYQALPTAKKNDGTIYFVSENSVGANGLKVIDITTAEYNVLTPEQKNNGIPYFVHD